MREPTGCALWRDPAAVADGPLKERFELIATFEEESHWWRYLLKCRECGQLYVFEFDEDIDWAGGNDPQRSTWVPVDTQADIDRLRQTERAALAAFVPRLCKAWPADADRPAVYWVKT